MESSIHHNSCLLGKIEITDENTLADLLTVTVVIACDDKFYGKSEILFTVQTGLLLHTAGHSFLQVCYLTDELEVCSLQL